MSPDRSFEGLFLDNLPLIDRIIASIARRQGLAADEREELASVVKLKIIERDYECFRRYRGASSLATYLGVVISMLAADYHIERNGRWRPSAAARKQGDIAVRLETLVHRRGYRLEEAAELLRTSGETQMSDRELARVLAELPPREPMRPREISVEHIGDTPAPFGADMVVLVEDANRERQQVSSALEHALGGLSVEDRVVVRMRYWEGMNVADIARMLGVEQKPLYRRLERSMSQLRDALISAGINAATVKSVLGEGEVSS